MQDFIITQKNNIWWGMFPRLTQAGFGNACSCRLHGESSLVPGTLNLALHVGDDADLVLQNRRLFAQALGWTHQNLLPASRCMAAMLRW